MRLAIIGAGWVGVVTATVLADLGHDVVCTDVNPDRIAQLSAGVAPFVEPGLEELLTRALSSGRLRFTGDNAEAMGRAQVVFCCVNTPTGADGATDLQAVMTVAEDFARYHLSGAVFVIKSTVPAGTAAQVRNLITELTPDIAERSFTVASNPEFLAESTAIRDTLTPSRIVIGASEPETLQIVSEVYAPIVANGAPVFTCDCATAEVIKTAANSYLATRISFINEIANYCQVVGADPMAVAIGLGFDPRIGALRPGVGYGGGCFPKDVKALLHEGELAGVSLSVLAATNAANYQQRELFFGKLSAALGDLSGKKIAILGLAFKPKTDDTRDAPALTLIGQLRSAGAEVVVYDPVVKSGSVREFPDLIFADTAMDAAEHVDALVCMCEWEEFKQLDLVALKNVMRGNVLADGRYVWSKSAAVQAGFTYLA
ncbi:MAG: UDP-glucose/GDP-mannose dehydrogenase family protein [Patescibacteria group bacterium]